MLSRIRFPDIYRTLMTRGTRKWSRNQIWIKLFSVGLSEHRLKEISHSPSTPQFILLHRANLQWRGNYVGRRQYISNTIFRSEKTHHSRRCWTNINVKSYCVRYLSTQNKGGMPKRTAVRAINTYIGTYEHYLPTHSHQHLDQIHPPRSPYHTLHPVSLFSLLKNKLKFDAIAHTKHQKAQQIHTAFQ